MNSVISRRHVLVGATVALAAAVFIQTAFPQSDAGKPVLKGFPFTGESLSYAVNWPSGLSLGEARLSSAATTAGWHLEFSLDASIPGFAVADIYRAAAGASLCSESFSKDSTHGSRRNQETITIDQATGTATRATANSAGVSKIAIPDCARDALTYLFYARRELGQGRVPAAQQIIFGALYDASLDYGGAETIMVGDKRTVTDKMICHIRGPASDIRFDAYFDRDAARTPVSIRVPLTLGTFSLEIVR
jgi:hypothetical protein